MEVEEHNRVYGNWVEMPMGTMDRHQELLTSRHSMITQNEVDTLRMIMFCNPFKPLWTLITPKDKYDAVLFNRF